MGKFDDVEDDPPPLTEADFPRSAAKTRPTPLKVVNTPPDLLGVSFWIGEAKVQTALPYVVKGIFGRNQIIVFWGAPGSGKTFASMELACFVGAGKPWHGRRTKRGVVIYVAAESARSYIENRFAALKQQYPDLEDSDVLVIPLALDLRNLQKGDVSKIIETAKAVAAGEGEVVLIVVDTLAVTFGGGNENSPEDMGTYVANIIEIRQQTGAAVLVVHHAGKDEAKGMRGHSALLGALDAELVIEGKNGEDRILRTGKIRDGDGYTDLFAFNLRRVVIGTDPDGDEVSTCVIDAKDDAGTKEARRGKKGLGVHQRHVFKVLAEAGGGMVRAELIKKLMDEGMPKNRAYGTVGKMIESEVLFVDAATFSVRVE